MKQKMFKELEFDKIIEKLSELALTERVKEKIKAIEPYMSEIEVERAMNETTQAKSIIENAGTPPLATMNELEKIIGLLCKDAMLLPDQLSDIRQFAASCKRMKTYLKRVESMSLEVAFYGNSINDLSELENEIDLCIRGGMVDDRASSTLASIRKKIEQANEQIKAKLNSIIQNNKNYLSDSLVIIRNGHYTLPVKKEYKNQISGRVLDISNSGGTYFIEPEAIGKMQEKVSFLQIDEDNEVRKILYTLTALVESFLPQIKVNIEAMETLDFVFAKAKLSLSMKAKPVEITTKRKIIIKGGRHPLINKDVAVPLDFYIGEGNLDQTELIQGVVITGPNTGGKTVALKTVGLFSLMAQCGLHLPVEECTICMNNMVLCDIGDGQSISENLSTFSAHMTNIIKILNFADDESLVLLDELGSGTDPAEGMGLAVAILEELCKKGCLIVATTHYPEIKEFASRRKEFINARMAFDRINLMPLYRLEIGEAGESCALYIAKCLGLKQHMIERANEVAYGKNSIANNTKKIDFNDIKKVDTQKVQRNVNNQRIQKKEDYQKKNNQGSNNSEPRSSKFKIGDSVIVYPQKSIGIVYKEANDKGEIGVQIKGKKILINHKRIKLHIAAKELYPEDYDFSIVFDSVENRKKKHQMGRKYDPNIVIEE